MTRITRTWCHYTGECQWIHPRRDRVCEDGGVNHPTGSPDWQRPPATSPQIRNDALIAAGIFCLSILTLALFRAVGLFEDPAGPVVSLLCLALISLPLAVRRVRPGLVAIAVSSGVVAAGELEVPEALMRDIALFLAIYTLGAWAPQRRRANVLRWILVGAMALWLFSMFFRATLDPEIAEDLGLGGLTPALASMLLQLVINLLYFAAAIWFGNRSWERARADAQLEEQAEQLRAERETVASQAVALERLRIARELHDSVAHHVSLMGVQAGAARTVLASDPAEAETFIRHIEDSARRSVAEMRSLLGVLRDETPDETGTAAASSLGMDQVESLITDARSTGLQVDFSVLGEPLDLRPLVSLCLYRITQEALTNVRKHAGADSQTHIVLRYQPDSVELEIWDDGAGRRRKPQVGIDSQVPGHGLAGMRERVEALNGQLRIAPDAAAGFTVRAELPLQPESRGSVLVQSAGGTDVQTLPAAREQNP